MRKHWNQMMVLAATVAVAFVIPVASAAPQPMDGVCMYQRDGRCYCGIMATCVSGTCSGGWGSECS